jgi:hypothetical protein
VFCGRPSAGSKTVNIRWRVVEFPSRVTNRTLQVNCANDTTSVDLSSNPVTPGETFLLLSSTRDVTNQGSTVPRLAELKSSNLAEIRKTGGCTPFDINYFQAVDYAGASVQRGRTSLASGSTSVQATLSSAVALNRSVLLYSYDLTGTGTKICDRALRGELTDATTVSFSRGEGDTTNCAGMQLPEISWEVVQFPVGTFVQQITRQLAGGTVASSITLPTPVDPSRSIVFMGGQWASGQVHGEGKYSLAENINEMRAQAALSTDGTTLTLTRESSNSSAAFTVYVVQFKP